MTEISKGVQTSSSGMPLTKRRRRVIKVGLAMAPH